MLLRPAVFNCRSLCHTKCYVELIVIIWWISFKMKWPGFMYLWLHTVCNKCAKDNDNFLPFFLSSFFLSFLQQIWFWSPTMGLHFDRFGRITNSKTDKVTDLKERKRSSKRGIVREEVRSWCLPFWRASTTFFCWEKHCMF